MDIFISVLLWTLCFLILCLLIILFGKTKLAVTISKKQGKEIDTKIVLVLLWGLVKLDLGEKSAKEKKLEAEAVEKIKKDERKFIEKAKYYYGIFCDFAKAYFKHRRKLRKSISLDRIYLNIDFGLGDAAKTGIYLGTLWAAMYNAAALVSRIVRISEPKFSVNPHYNESIAEFQSELIISARAGRLLLALAGIAWSFWRFNRKRKKRNKIKKEKAAM